MPNYCECDLYLWAEKKADLDALLAAIGNEELALSFDKLRPPPPEIADPDPEELSNAEYQWRREHWGTKWDLVETELRRESMCEAIIRFRTAHTPPIPIVRFIANAHPKVGVCIEYFERGMEFSGGWRMDPEREPGEERKPREWDCNSYAGRRGG